MLSGGAGFKCELDKRVNITHYKLFQAFLRHALHRAAFNCNADVARLNLTVRLCRASGNDPAYDVLAVLLLKKQTNPALTHRKQV